jgi:glycosyltransferase involved in cell wall biosynthesis
MRLLLLVSGMNLGGAQRVAATLVNSWAERGDDVTLMPTFSGRGSCSYALHPSVKLVYLADRTRFPQTLLGNRYARFAALRQFIAAERPDVVLSFLTPVNVAAILAARNLGVPVIVSERVNPLADKDTHVLWRWLRGRTYLAASAVVLQTQDVVAEFTAQIPGVRSRVIPNPLPRDLPMAGSATDHGSRRRIVAMGRLEPQKNFATLIDAFSGLRDDFPEWDLFMWGEGSLMSALQRQVRRLSLEGRVFLPGSTVAPWSELARADVFALTSSYEGFPNVLLEAMAMGVASVTFDCPSGPREISRDGTDAVLVRNGDSAALRAALARVMRDPSLRRLLAETGAESVRRRYALPAVLSEWDALLQQVLPQHVRCGGSGRRCSVSIAFFQDVDDASTAESSCEPVPRCDR